MKKEKRIVSKKANRLLYSVLLSLLMVSFFSAIYAFIFRNESNNNLTGFQLWVFLSVLQSVFLISISMFDFYTIDYRFWKKVLGKRWLYRIVFCLWLLLTFLIFFLIFIFPNWWIVIVGGIALGLIRGLTQNGVVKGGIVRSPSILSYKKLYDYYIARTDYWEKKLQKHQEKRKKKF